MFQSLGTPAFLREARHAGGRSFSPVITVLIFFVVYFVAAQIESIVLVPFLFVALLNDPDFYALVQDGADMQQIVSYTEELVNGSPVITLGMLFSTVGIIVSVIVFCRLIEKRSFASMGLSRQGALLSIAKGVGVGFVALALATAFACLFGALRFEGVNGQANVLYILLFFVAFLIQGFAEEVLFRGYLMVSTAKRMPLWMAMVVSSFAFALLHGGNNGFDLLGFVNLFLFGILAALFMIRGGSLWGAAALHAVWNFAEGILLGGTVSGIALPTSVFVFSPVEGKSFLHGGAFGPEGGLAVTFALALFVALYGMMKTKEKEDGLPPL